jgi:hypothetical protein
LGLSILAGGLSFVGAANATDLIWNGSFESPGFGYPTGPNSGSGTDWNGFFESYNYSTAYYDGPAIPASENPGDYYASNPAAGWSMWDNFSTPIDEGFFLGNVMYAYALNQTVSLTNAVSGTNIDAGYGQYTFSTWLASYTPWPDQPFVMLRFFDDTATQVATTGVQIGNDGYPTPDGNTTSVIFDRTTNTFAVTYADGTTTIPSDLSGDHKWIKYVATGTVPAGARKARVYVTRSPNAGRYQDGGHEIQAYVDLVKLNVIDTSQSSVSPPIIVRAPVDQIAAVGNTARFSLAAVGPEPLSYQLRLDGTNIPGNSTTLPGDTSVPTLSLAVPLKVGTYTVDVVVTNSGGAVTSSPPATLTVINPAVFVAGQWDFLDANLAPTVGAALEYGDATAQSDTTFGTTTSFGIPDINGVPTAVMHFAPSTTPVWWGYKLFPSAPPNGGGTNINQYTLIYDIYYPVGSDGYRSLWQTDVNNTLYSSLYIGNADVGFGIGVGSTYDGAFTNGVWHRLAFAIDLNGPGGQAPIMAKFIDGVKVADQTTDLSPADGSLSVGAYGLLFAEASGDFAPGYVSSVQFSNGRRPDAFIEALGGSSALKIPGAIKASVSGGVVTIKWTGGVALQQADSLTGTWSTVDGTAGQSSYNPPAGQKKFFRPQIP